MLENTRLHPNVRAIVRGHHERWNGQGYPDGLIGTRIHRDAHIVTVADAYEALTADRPYRKGIPPYYALEMLLSWSAKDFNPHVVEAFRKALILYPGNAVVTLNTGEVGWVVSAPKETPTRPLVRLLFDRDGKSANRETNTDLMEKLTCFIQRVEFGEAESSA
ncbi:cyclic di-GMP phosphodiesterase response regulator RpfG [Peptococcaceae bacterium CEB3]|nr:cyclic di-GMP phosphodiesterase response regulator RpfG [Peptococcaceae bacterium CEB3]